jgi:molybdopterin converting factor small subunit
LVAVKVKFFGVVRGLTDGPSTVVEMDNDATLADLLEELHKKYGKRFYDGVLCESNGLKGHVKLFMNDAEIDSRKLATTKVAVAGAAAETMLYVVPSTAGG